MDFVKEYKNNMIERAKKELKFGIDAEVRAVNGDSKMTIDGINYFYEIIGVEIFDHNIKIGEYYFDKKVLTTPNRIRNIAVLKNQIKLINDFVGFEKVGFKKGVLNKFYNFMDKADDGLSEFEVAEMYEFCK